MKNYENYALGKWIKGDGEGTPLYNAINGDQIGIASSKLVVPEDEIFCFPSI